LAAELVDNRHLPALLVSVGHELTMCAWRLAGALALDMVVCHQRLMKIAVEGPMPVVSFIEHLS
jgi:hypothetical protein